MGQSGSTVNAPSANLGYSKQDIERIVAENEALKKENKRLKDEAQKCKSCAAAAKSSTPAGTASANATSTVVAAKQHPKNASSAAPLALSSTGSQSSASPTEVVFLFGCARRYFIPSKDYDFTNVSDDGKKFMRGGHAYVRPVGSKRYALDIRGKFKPDDSWIEGNDYAVAYHGTSLANATQIIKAGVDITKAKRKNYGKGIYCSPDPKTALVYSTAYERSGKKYKLLIQVRVHKDKVNIVKPDGDLSCGAYWLDSDATSFRPYAICEYAQ